MNSSPPTVCFYCADQNRHRDRSRGITHYTHELMAHLRDANAARLLALTSKSSFAVPAGIEQVSLPFASDWLPGRLVSDHLHPLFASRVEADIWHYPKGFLPLGLQVKARKVGTVADVMLQRDADHHPESRSRAAFAYWIGMLRRSLSQLDLVVTVSEFSRQDILRFCERHGVKAPPIVVTYEGVTVQRRERCGRERGLRFAPRLAPAAQGDRLAFATMDPAERTRPRSAGVAIGRDARRAVDAAAGENEERQPHASAAAP